jgi:hypothetical protein
MDTGNDDSIFREALQGLHRGDFGGEPRSKHEACTAVLFLVQQPGQPSTSHEIITHQEVVELKLQKSTYTDQVSARRYRNQRSC